MAPLLSTTTQTPANHTNIAQGLYADPVLLLAFSERLANMDLTWMADFLKGMVKPLAATVVVLLAVALSFMQKLGLGGEMIYSIARAFVQLSIIGFVLQFIFTRNNAAWIILAYLFMVCDCLFCVAFLLPMCLVSEKIEKEKKRIWTDWSLPFFKGLITFLSMLIGWLNFLVFVEVEVSKRRM